MQGILNLILIIITTILRIIYNLNCTILRGVSAITADKEYLQNRYKFLNKTKRNLKEGLNLGV